MSAKIHILCPSRVYLKLKDKQSTAIQFAKKLLARYGANHNPESGDSTSTG